MPLNPNITQWITLVPSIALPHRKIILMWNGKNLIGPKSFKSMGEALAFQDEWKITRYLEVPDARVES